MNRIVASRRRSLGSYYTPEWLARMMVERCGLELETRTPAEPWRMLDPACGDGAFVLALLEQNSRIAADRLSLVREHIFGVDADPAAIDSLRVRVAAWIGFDSTRSDEVQRVLKTNFVCGDALLGPDWNDSPQESLDTPESAVPAIDWRATFPQVAVAGGFDLVIGNPPYRRERNARIDFDRIATSPLGRRWRRARMDLWHYFLHRGLDLLKPGGTLCYIVNSYWTGATAAQPLVARLATETTMDEIILFGSAKLFCDVSGRHLIFRTRKCLDAQATCRISDLSKVPLPDLENELKSPSEVRVVPQTDLWRGGRMRLEAVASQGGLPELGPKLGEVFEVRQGIAENPPFVTKAIAAELNNPSLIGRGVFVLTESEVEALGLSTRERTLLRPYYALSTVSRFQIAPRPSHWLLYLTKQTAPTLEGSPRVAAHLAPYRPALERRREVVSRSIAWWHLHWPREERLFTSPRILCPQMGCAPRFAWAERPTFVGFSQHVIVERVHSHTNQRVDQFGPSLAALSAILNSSPARGWFEAHAKRRGANLDISGSVLKQLPLPCRRDAERERELDRLACEWSMRSGDQLQESEARLDRLVEELYREA